MPITKLLINWLLIWSQIRLQITQLITDYQLKYWLISYQLINYELLDYGFDYWLPNWKLINFQFG